MKNDLIKLCDDIIKVNEKVYELSNDCKDIEMCKHETDLNPSITIRLSISYGPSRDIKSFDVMHRPTRLTILDILEKYFSWQLVEEQKHLKELTTEIKEL